MTGRRHCEPSWAKQSSVARQNKLGASSPRAPRHDGAPFANLSGEVEVRVSEFGVRGRFSGVGWVEPLRNPAAKMLVIMGFAALYPAYGSASTYPLDEISRAAAPGPVRLSPRGRGRRAAAGEGVSQRPLSLAVRPPHPSPLPPKRSKSFASGERERSGARLTPTAWISDSPFKQPKLPNTQNSQTKNFQTK